MQACDNCLAYLESGKVLHPPRAIRSKSITDAIYLHLMTQQKSSLMAFLSQASPHPSLQGLRGVLFEAHVHAQLATAASHKIKYLNMEGEY